MSTLECRRLVAFLLIVLAVGSFVPTSAFAQSPKRVALVVGNSSYPVGPLKNPSSDADAMASALRGLGFQVTKLKDLSRYELEDAVDETTDGLKTGDLCLIFFAGHGLQVDGENYIVPVDAKVEREHHVRQRCVSISYLLDALDVSGASLKVVVIDSCRDNPFRSFVRSSSSSFSKLSAAPEGTIVSFSTAPQTVALDGAGANSPFTRHLVRALGQQPSGGLEILDVFREASRAVKNEVGQTPYLELDATIPRFFLRQPTGNAPLGGGDEFRMLKLFGDNKISRAHFDLWKSLSQRKGQLTVQEQAQLNTFARLAKGDIEPDQLPRVLTDIAGRDFGDTSASELEGNAVEVTVEELPHPAKWASLRALPVEATVDIDVTKLRAAGVDVDAIFDAAITAASATAKGPNHEEMLQFLHAVKAELLRVDAGFSIGEAARGEASQPEYFYAGFKFRAGSEAMDVLQRVASERSYYTINGQRYFGDENFLVRFQAPDTIWIATPQAFMHQATLSPQVSTGFKQLRNGRALGVAVDLTPFPYPASVSPTPNFVSVSVDVSGGSDLMHVVVDDCPDAILPMLQMMVDQDRSTLVEEFIRGMQTSDPPPPPEVATFVREMLLELQLQISGHRVTARVPSSQARRLVSLINQGLKNIPK